MNDKKTRQKIEDIRPEQRRKAQGKQNGTGANRWGLVLRQTAGLVTVDKKVGGQTRADVFFGQAIELLATSDPVQLWASLAKTGTFLQEWAAEMERNGEVGLVK